MKTSPTLYVSKVLIRHDKTPNVTDTNIVSSAITGFSTPPTINNKNSKRTEITRTFPVR